MNATAAPRLVDLCAVRAAHAALSPMLEPWRACATDSAAFDAAVFVTIYRTLSGQAHLDRQAVPADAPFDAPEVSGAEIDRTISELQTAISVFNPPIRQLGPGEFARWLTAHLVTPASRSPLLAGVADICPDVETVECLLHRGHARTHVIARLEVAVSVAN